MNLTGRPPIGLKDDRPRDNPRHLERVRSLPCCICEAFGEMQDSATQAHHPIHDRWGTQKVSDQFAIPLCEGHHQGLVDRSKVAIHRDKAAWREMYGADHEWVAATLDKLAAT